MTDSKTKPQKRAKRSFLRLSLYGLLALVTGFAAILFLAPAVLPWTAVARAVVPSLLEGSGYRANLEGEVDVESLLPMLELRVGRVSLYEGEQTNPIAAFDSLEAKATSMELLRGNVDVKRIVLDGLLVDLTDFARAPSKEDETATQAAADAERAFEETLEALLREARRHTASLRVVALEITNGALRLPVEAGQETISLGDISLTGERADPESPLTLWSEFFLNGLPSEAFVTLENFSDLGATNPLQFELGLESDLIHAFAKGAAELGDAKSLRADLQVKSVALSELGHWLRIPTGAGRPGEVIAFLRFAADGEGLLVDEFAFRGDSLEISGDGGMDWPMPGRPIDAHGNLEVSKLLLDPLLGLLPEDRPAPPKPFADFGPLIGEKQIDISFLRELDLDFHVRADGIAVAGESIGPVTFDAVAEEGFITARLGNLQIAGGRLLGNLSLDARQEQLIFSSDLAIDRVSLMRLAEIAGQDEGLVAGDASGRLRLNSVGDNPRDLAAGLSGELQLDAGGVEVTEDTGERFSGVKIDLQLPGGENRPYVLASFKRAGIPLWIDLETGPLSTAIDRAPLPVDLIVGSPIGQMRFDGRLLQRPLPGLDGRLQANLPDPAAVAEWFGLALASRPSAITLDAVFAGDGRRNRLQSFTLAGGGLDMEAMGGLAIEDDGSRLFDLEVNAGNLVLTPYAGTSGGEGENGGEGPTAEELKLLAGWSGEARINARSLTVDNFQTGSTVLAVKLAESQFSAAAKSSGLLGGSAEGDIQLPFAEGSGRLQFALSNLASAQLLNLLGTPDITLSDNVSGTLQASVGPILQGVPVNSGSLELALPSLTHAVLPDRLLSGGTLSASVEGNTLRAGLQGGTISGQGLEPEPIALSAEVLLTSPLPEGIEGASATLSADLASAAARVEATLPAGDTPMQARMTLQTENLDQLLKIAKAEIGLPLPLEASAQIADDRQGTLRLDELQAYLGESDLSGNAAIALGGVRPRITADLRSKRLNLNELTANKGVVEPLMEEAPADRILNDEEVVPVDLLQALDGELKLFVEDFRSLQGFDAVNAEFSADLRDGVLDFQVLRSEFKSLGGQGTVRLEVDSNAVEPAVSLAVTARRADYGVLLKSLDVTDRVGGEMDVDVELTGQGRSIAQIAATANGFSKVVAKDGSLDTGALGFFAFGATDLLLPFMGGSSTNNMRCFISAIDFEDGIGKLRVQLLDAGRFSVAGRGSLNLKDETLSMTFSPSSNTPSLLSFAVPFNVGGTFANPTFVPSPTGTLLQVGKIAGSLFNPLVGLGILAADTAMANMDNCAAALAVANGEVQPHQAEETLAPASENPRN